MKILVKSIYNQGYIYVSASVSSSILTSLPALFPEDEKSKKNAVRWINFFICQNILQTWLDSLNILNSKCFIKTWVQFYQNIYC